MRLSRFSLLAIFLLSFFPACLQAAVVTRGPYLQSGTDTSIIVRWRTDTPTDSRVNYGDAPGNLISSSQDPVSTTEHSVTISGLTADTRYYYSIGSTSSVLAGDDSSHYFNTSPSTGTSAPTRIWVIGDSGFAITDTANVRDSYKAWTGSTHTDLWLMLGDNAYHNGTDIEYQRAVFDFFPELLRQSVLWPSYGNHDGNSADSSTQTGPYYDIFELPTAGEAGGVASGTEAYYSFDYANIHFVVLDSYESDRSVNGAMMTWLQLDVQATTQEWIIAYWHHPPYSHGSHNSDFDSLQRQMRENALPILEDAGVDLVLSGHSHSYERSFLINGHYDVSSTFDAQTMAIDAGDGRADSDGAYKYIYNESDPYLGAVYSVPGSASHVSGGSLNHPVMSVSLNVLASLVLDVDGNQLHATALDDTGSVIDYYSIIKNPDNCPFVTNPSQQDTDGDGIGDACEDDTDGDGLSNTFEQSIGTDPLLMDSDGDGLTDYFEVNYDGDPSGYIVGSDLNPLDVDTDSDGMTDFDELNYNGDPSTWSSGFEPDPLNPDTDIDGQIDGVDTNPVGVNAYDGDLAPLGAPDGVVNLGDVVVATRIVLGLHQPTSLDYVHGDVWPQNAPDGIIDVRDLMVITNIVLTQ